MLIGPTRRLRSWRLWAVAGLLALVGAPLLASAWSPSNDPALSTLGPAALEPVATLSAADESDTAEPRLAGPEPASAPGAADTATAPPLALPETIIAPTTTAMPAPPVAPPSGPPRIGLQAGHWRANELPDELARLRGASGGSGGGRQEWEVNLEIAEAVAGRLRERGYAVDILPATVPPDYTADVFLSIHADASVSPMPHGYKIARSAWSRLPITDDALVAALREEYSKATSLPWDDAITRNMTRYYAFNNRRREHAIDQTTPGAILEMGYLTSAADRDVLFNRADRVVEGVVNGLVHFLETRPPVAEREQPTTVGAALIIGENGAAVRSAPSADASVMATIEGGRRQDSPEVRGDWYGIWVTERGAPGWVHKSEATVVQVALP